MIELTYKVGSLTPASIIIKREQLIFALSSLYQMAQQWAVSNVTFKSV